MKMLVAEKHQLPQMNAVQCPEGVNEAAVRKTLLNEFGIEIGAGLGPLKGKIWRIGLMGYSCRPDNVMLCLSALGSVLSDMGVPVHVGDAEAAAHGAYAQMHVRTRNARKGPRRNCITTSTRMRSSCASRSAGATPISRRPKSAPLVLAESRKRNRKRILIELDQKFPLSPTSQYHLVTNLPKIGFTRRGAHRARTARRKRRTPTTSSTCWAATTA